MQGYSTEGLHFTHSLFPSYAAVNTENIIGVLINPWPDQEGNTLQRPNSFTSHSKTVQKVVRPTRSPRQQWTLRQTKNGDLSIGFFQSGRAKDLSAPLYFTFSADTSFFLELHHHFLRPLPWIWLSHQLQYSSKPQTNKIREAISQQQLKYCHTDMVRWSIEICFFEWQKTTHCMFNSCCGYKNNDQLSDYVGRGVNAVGNA